MQPPSLMMNALQPRNNFKTRRANSIGTGGFATLMEMVRSTKMNSMAASARSLTSKKKMSIAFGT